MISPQSVTHAADRVLKLELIDDKKPLNSIGVTDPRLFKQGDDANKLHAVMDGETCLWTFRYEKGAIPAALKGSYTGFKALKKFAEAYFLQRNIRITEEN